MFEIPSIMWLCIFANCFVFYLIISGEYRKRNIGAIKTFYVRTAFAFPEKHDRWIGLCTYFTEDVLLEAATEEKVSFGEFLQKHSPTFKFENVQPVSQTCVKNLYKLPERLLVSEESLKKNSTIIFTNSLTVAIMVKPGDADPLNTYWFGTLLQADTPKTVQRILKEYRKRVKEGTCQIVPVGE